MANKLTPFNNPRYTTNIPTDPCTVTTADIKANMHDIHTSIVSQYLAARENKILRAHPPQVSSTEENIPQHKRRTLAQLDSRFKIQKTFIRHESIQYCI